MISGAGALLALLGPFGIGVAATGVFLIVVGVVISAPSARNPGPYMREWWTVMTLAALTCLAGIAIGFLVTALGGILLAAGAIVTLVAVVLGSPPDPDEDRSA